MMEDAHDSLRELQGFEEGVSLRIRDNHSDQISVVDIATDEMLRALLGLGQGWIPSSDLNQARILLVLRSLNALRTARLLLGLGYYEQSLSLLRVCNENALTTLDARHNPDTIEKLKNTTRFDYTRMAERVDRAIGANGDFFTKWKQSYSAISDFAHPGGVILQFLAPAGEEGSSIAYLGPYYHKGRVLGVLKVMASETINLTGIIETMMHEEGFDWHQKAYQTRGLIHQMIADLFRMDDASD